MNPQAQAPRARQRARRALFQSLTREQLTLVLDRSDLDRSDLDCLDRRSAVLMVSRIQHSRRPTLDATLSQMPKQDLERVAAGLLFPSWGTRAQLVRRFYDWAETAPRSSRRTTAHRSNDKTGEIGEFT